MNKKTYSEAQIILLIIITGIVLLVVISIFNFFIKDETTEEENINKIVEASKKWAKNQELELGQNYYVSTKELVEKKYLSKQILEGCVKISNLETPEYIYKNTTCEQVMDSKDYIIEKNNTDQLIESNKEYIFKGINPNNYITISGNLYRIIKLDEYGIKAITNKVIEERSWDSAGIRKEIDNSYCTDEKEGCNAYVANASNVTQDSEIHHYLETVYTNNINSNLVILNNKGVWNIELYEGEIKQLKDEKNINTLTSNIGLINYKEFIEASTNSDYKKDNWLIIDKSFWTINGMKNSSSKVWIIDENGNMSIKNASENCGVRPVIYINYNVKLTGEGTIDNPYIIK